MFKQYRTDPLTEREKNYLRRSKGIVLPHSAAVGPKPADAPKDKPTVFKKSGRSTAPTFEGWKPPRKKRGGSGCRMSAEHRSMVELHKANREAFFKAIRG